MKDGLLLLIILSLLPLIFRRPVLGTYVWIWLSIFSPHKVAWGVASSLPLLDMVVILTILSCFINKHKIQKIPKHSIITIFYIWIAWCSLTTIFAVSYELAIDKWVWFIKNSLLVVIILITCNSKRKLKGLLLVVLISVSFVAIKGGLFTIATGGSYRVWGVTGTQWGDNNGVAMVCNLLFPISYALAKLEVPKGVKFFLTILAVLMFVTVLGTQSRGGLVGIVGVCTGLFIFSKNKVKILLVLLMISVVALLLMPSSWTDRMNTITSAEDQSSQTRITQWKFMTNIANDSLLGAGYKGNFSDEYQLLFMADEIEENRYRDPHSTYFEVLGEHGYIGLIIYILLLYKVIKTLLFLYSQNDSFKVLYLACCCSFMGFLFNATVRTASNLDVVYILIASVVLMSHLRTISEGN